MAAWVAALACSTARPACAQAPPVEVPAGPLPFATVVGGGPGLLVLRPDPAAVVALAARERARWDLPLPDGDGARLVLERVPLATLGLGLRVDGVAAPELVDALGLTLWRGAVEGAPDSDVYLALSPFGCRGWVRRGDERLAIDAVPAVGEAGWARSTMHVVRPAADLRAEPFDCAPPPGAPSPPPMRVDAGAAPAGGPLYEARVAVETDHQLFRLFGSLEAEASYLIAVLGAVSLRFEADVGVRLRYPYLALWPEPDDPWPWDLDVHCSYAWLELAKAWGAGNLPEGAHLGHLVSGTRLSCGLSQRDSLCDPRWGFSVSGGFHGDAGFPFEKGPGPLNRDVWVVAHELGHSFGSAHTNQACPPLEECAPEWIFGPCQTRQVCTRGTIMSVCVMCPGRMENVFWRFHPAVAARLRQRVEASCVPPAGG
jgi:hypothetical protein